MNILSVTGEHVPPGKGGSPADTFDRSIVTYAAEKDTQTLTVTYVRYFEKVLKEKGIYDPEAGGIPVNKIVALLFLEKYPNTKGNRHYINDENAFLALFDGFSLDKFVQKYGSMVR